MKEYNGLEIPVGVSLTHDKGRPVVFAYVGGKGRLGMRAKRFNPRTCGSMERALKQAIRWRKQALREHTAAVAALDEPAPGKPAVAVVPRPRKVAPVVRKPAAAVVVRTPRKVTPVRKPVAVPKRKVTPVKKSAAVVVPPRKVTPVRKPAAVVPTRKVAAVRKPAAAPQRPRRKPVPTRRPR